MIAYCIAMMDRTQVMERVVCDTVWLQKLSFWLFYFVGVREIFGKTDHLCCFHFVGEFLLCVASLS